MDSGSHAAKPIVSDALINPVSKFRNHLSRY